MELPLIHVTAEPLSMATFANVDIVGTGFVEFYFAAVDSVLWQ